MQDGKNSTKGAMNLANLLSAICELGNTEAAKAIGREASFISRLKTNEKQLTLEDFAVLTAAAGLEIIPTAESTVSVDRELLTSLRHLAKMGINSMLPEGDK
jgi:hypothetical protein